MTDNPKQKQNENAQRSAEISLLSILISKHPEKAEELLKKIRQGLRKVGVFVGNGV